LNHLQRLGRFAEGPCTPVVRRHEHRHARLGDVELFMG
jgi:hypothetical protein